MGESLPEEFNEGVLKCSRVSHYGGWFKTLSMEERGEEGMCRSLDTL